jgi:hypothetical protein
VCEQAALEPSADAAGCRGARESLSPAQSQAPLRDGDYGGAVKVDMFTSCTQPSGAGCGNGNLSEIGILDSSQGVTFLPTQADQQSNAALSGYLRGIVPDPRTQFRAVGTVSFAFKADSASHVGG